LASRDLSLRGEDFDQSRAATVRLQLHSIKLPAERPKYGNAQYPRRALRPEPQTHESIGFAHQVLFLVRRRGSADIFGD
jgi:hypothetical protein